MFSWLDGEALFKKRGIHADIRAKICKKCLWVRMSKYIRSNMLFNASKLRIMINHNPDRLIG